MKKKIQERPLDHAIYQKALSLGVSPVVANLLGRRSIPQETLAFVLHPRLQNIPSPFLLKDINIACKRLVQAIVQKEYIGILTDYDVDGITSHAILYQALVEYFDVDPSQIQSLIGHRLEDGYGVSANLVEKILSQDKRPDLVITADCGSSDEERFNSLKAAGIDVIVTDHHGIPEQGVPQSALVTINPMQEGCAYPDKSIAGCMVSWLVMSALRQHMINLGLLAVETPKLFNLLDYVALGTVADAVSLGSPVNRALVRVGLSVMNQCERSAWRAFKALLERNGAFEVDDLGFQMGPRINARGRIADPSIALTFLLTSDDAVAVDLLQILNENNEARKKIEHDMLKIARLQADAAVEASAVSVVSTHESFHLGVQGIVASRIVERVGRVCVVLSPTLDPKILSGSVRSIEKVHVREVLSRVHAAHPGLLKSFGGHAGAAGLKLPQEHLELFKQAFEHAVQEQLNTEKIEPIVWTDGSLPKSRFDLACMAEFEQLVPFGRGFPAPLFEDVFEVITLGAIGKIPVHFSLQLRKNQHQYRAVWFNALTQPEEVYPFEPGDQIHCAFKFTQNVYQGCARLQLLIECANLVHSEVEVSE